MSEFHRFGERRRVELRLSVRLLGVVAIAAVFGGCTGDQAATASVEPLSVRSFAAAPTAAGLLASAVSGKSNRSFEDEILRLEAAVPEVGGVFADGEVLVVFLTDMRAVGALHQALAKHVPTWRVPDERKARALSSAVRVLPAKYAFSDWLHGGKRWSRHATSRRLTPTRCRTAWSRR